jgi:predicted membrane protein
MRSPARLRGLPNGGRDIGQDEGLLARCLPILERPALPKERRPLRPLLFIVSLLVLSLSSSVMADGPTPPARQRVYNLAATTDLVCFVCFLVIFGMGGRYRAVLCLGLTAVYLGVTSVLYMAFKAAPQGGGNIGELPIVVFLLIAVAVLTGLGLTASLVFGLVQLKARPRRVRFAATRRRYRLRRVLRRTGLTTCLLLIVAFALSAVCPFQWTWKDRTPSLDSRHTFSLSRGTIGASTSHRVLPGAQRPWSGRNGFDFHWRPPLIWLCPPYRQTTVSGYRYHLIRIPLWVPFLVFLIPTVLLWRREGRGLPAGHCHRCGYDLTGNVSGVCPECGTELESL